MYIGELKELFLAVDTSLSEDGYFIATVEMRQGEGFRLQHTGRYKHSLSYIQDCFSPTSMIITRRGIVDLRKGSGEWVKGILIVARKSTQKR